MQLSVSFLQIDTGAEMARLGTPALLSNNVGLSYLMSASTMSAGCVSKIS